MPKQKFYIILVLLFTLAFSTKVFASLTFTSSAITGTTASTIDLGSGHDLYLQTSGGNVGIGTTSPTSLLHLNKTVDDFSPALYVYSTNADSEITLDASASPGGGTAAVNLTTGTQAWRMSINAIDVGNNWNVEDATAGTVPLTVEKVTGNVGIGTMEPSQKLEVNGGVRLNTATAQPTCDTTVRGTFWVVQGGAGVKDTVKVCAKDAADTYAWRTIY